MTLNLPLWLRRALYALTVVGTPVIVYAKAKGWIGELEIHLWDGEVVVASGIALFHSQDTNQATVTAPANIEVTPLEETPPEGGW